MFVEQFNNPISFKTKINLEVQVGRFLIKTIGTDHELQQAFKLRYQVFQVEMLGHSPAENEDQDQYDMRADHLAIFDAKTNQMIATCRLTCSLFSNEFYSEQEFVCQELLGQPGTKLELGRVCVHKDFRKGIVIMLLWKALAEYMMKSEARYLFGCGSVATLDPAKAALLYRFLEEQGKIKSKLNISPTEKYKSADFQKNLIDIQRPLTDDEKNSAAQLLPPLCRSYFDMGCFTPCAPAFDLDFKCIDFLTILDLNLLDSKVRRKMMGLS